MAEKKEATIYLVTSGDYDEYSVHSTWSDQETADKVVKLLNKESSWVLHHVEEFPLNGIWGGQSQLGFIARYDYGKFGSPALAENIRVEESIIYTLQPRHSNPSGRIRIKAQAETAEEAQQLIIDAVAEM